MNQLGPAIQVNVHSGTNLLFSCTKPVVDLDNAVKNAGLSSSLKAAQVQVNQFLTELVEKSGTQEKKQGQRDEASEEEDNEEDDEEDDEETENKFQSKRKVDDKNGSKNSVDIPGKRIKS